ncbi:MAG: hypothetical protein ABI678_02215 [Kofleriaceae bacterium]
MKFFSFAFVAFMVVACAASPTGTGAGGDDDSMPNGGSGSGGGGGGSISATDFLSRIDQKDCDEAFTCQASFPTMTGETFADDYGASAQECYADAAAYEMASVVESEITAGKIHFDGAAAAQCIAGITFTTCSAYWSTGGDYPAACDTAMVGTIADGAACVVDHDCANPASYCLDTHKCGADTGT